MIVAWRIRDCRRSRNACASAAEKNLDAISSDTGSKEIKKYLVYGLNMQRFVFTFEEKQQTINQPCCSRKIYFSIEATVNNIRAYQGRSQQSNTAAHEFLSRSTL